MPNNSYSDIMFSSSLLSSTTVPCYFGFQSAPPPNNMKLIMVGGALICILQKKKYHMSIVLCSISLYISHRYLFFWSILCKNIDWQVKLRNINSSLMQRRPWHALRHLHGVWADNISSILHSISTCPFPWASSGEGGGLQETRAQVKVVVPFSHLSLKNTFGVLFIFNFSLLLILDSMKRQMNKTIAKMRLKHPA